MRDKLLEKLARSHADHPVMMLITVMIISIIFAFFGSQLTVTMRWSDLLPGKDPRTIEYDRILNEFTSASNIIVVVQGEEKQMKSFADALAPRLLSAIDTSQNQKCLKTIDQLKLKREIIFKKDSLDARLAGLDQEISENQARINFKIIQRVDYKNPMEFLRKHGLMLIKVNDLKNNQTLFENPNLPMLIQNTNTALEKVYVGQESSLSTREKRDNAMMFLDGLQRFTSKLDQSIYGTELSEQDIHNAADALLFGDPYFLSYDKSTLLMIAVPNFSAMEADRMISGTDAIHAILKQTLPSFPEVHAELTGMIPIGRDEMVYGEQSANYTSVIALVAILIMLMIAFRMWVAPLFAILNLMIGILWAIGVTAITVGQLNIMTQMMAVILLGLGIDFSIHFISGFTEHRAAGESIHQALSSTFLNYGKGIITGALTTAFAFLTLMISSSRGMKEMGLVTGLGLLAVLLTTFLVLPTFLVFRERRFDKKRDTSKKRIQRDISFRFLGRTGQWLGQHFIFTLISVMILTGIFLWQASKITFDQNYLHMEPKGLPSITMQDTITDKFDMSMDYALVLANSVEESRNLAKQYRTLSTTAMTEDIGLYLPSNEEQHKRSILVQKIGHSMKNSALKSNLSNQEIKILSQEIERLAWNIMEIQDMAFLGGQDRVDAKCRELVGDPDKPDSNNPVLELSKKIGELSASERSDLNQFQRIFSPYYKKQVLAMSDTMKINLHMLPASILDRYANKDRSRFLISVYPTGSMWTDMAFLKQFVNDLNRVNDRATGMPTIFQALIEIIGRDGRHALYLTVLIIFVLLWIDFRHPFYAVIAMIPMAAGLLWMIGLMRFTGMQFTILNVMGLPMILGIGIDDGVHIMHRWLIEGKKDLQKVFASTGKAILLTTLTTMLAFGSLYFSVWRGFASLGSALFLGVGACFITTLIFLSGILGWYGKVKKTEND